MNSLLVKLLILSWFCSASSSLAQTTYDFVISGRLTESNGRPLAGPVSLNIKFYNVAAGGIPLLTVSNGLSSVDLQDGIFNIKLTMDATDYQTVFPNPNTPAYFEIIDLTNAPTVPYERSKVSILPYAAKIPFNNKIFVFDSEGKFTLAATPDSGKFLKANADGSLAWDTPAGGVSGSSATTFTNKAIDADTNTISNISDTNIKASAAIADTKLATISTAGKVSGSAITSGTIGGSAAVSTTGSIATSAKAGVGVAVGTSQLEVKGSGSTNATSSLNVANSAGTSSLFVRDDGNIGIGTTSPSSPLHLGISSTVANQKILSGTLGGNNLFAFQEGILANYGGTMSLYDGLGGAGYFRMAYDAGYPKIATTASSTTILGSGHQLRLTHAYTDITQGGSVIFYLDGTTARIGNNLSILQLGGTTSSYPAIKRNTTAINFRLADDSADASITAASGSFSGSLGVGTATPASKLSLAAPTSSNTVEFGFYNDGGSTKIGRIATDNNLKLILDGYNAAGVHLPTGLSIGSGSYGGNNPPTGGAIIQGNVGIGTTSATYKLTVNGEPAANGYTAFTNYSDRRLKRNIALLPEGALNKILELRPSTFQYNELTGYDEATRTKIMRGFIAQELREVFPEMVNETEIRGKTYLDTNLSYLQIYLVKAIQELKVTLDELFGNHDERISKLESENRMLREYICNKDPQATICAAHEHE